MPGIFGGLFDLDHDGEMSDFERGLEFMFLDELTSDKDEYDCDDEDDDIFDDDLDDDLDDDYDY